MPLIEHKYNDRKRLFMIDWFNNLRRKCSRTGIQKNWNVEQQKKVLEVIEICTEGSFL
jgi:hypothetical protein